MPDEAPSSNSRRGGRSSRVAMRAAAPLLNPAAPGQPSGRYRPLDESQLRAILDMAFRVLEEIGMGQVPPMMIEAGCARGATMTDTGRMLFPRSLIEDVIARAANSFVFCGRDPRHDFEVGGDKVYYGTAGAAVQTLDLDTGSYRRASLQDLYDFARLADTLKNVAWFSRCVVAADIEDIFEMDVNTAYALLRGTTKPVGTSFTEASHVDPIVDMFDLALGGEGKFRERPFCKAHVITTVSPLRFGEEAVEVTQACIRRGVPVSLIVASQSGATAPATLAGALVQSTAETLASLAVVDAFEPGFPAIFSNWPFVVDLRTGSFSGGGGECAVMNAAAAQIANHLNLPSGVSASMTDAKAVDAQMGVEKAITALATGLAGGNLIYESSGMMASLLGASFEAFLLDDEMLSHAYRVLRGIEVNEETMGFEVIRNAVMGPGHYLGGEHTLSAMERDYFYPTLSDRATAGVWEEGGAKTAWDRAKERAVEILAAPDPGYLSATIDAEIRSRYKIHLPPAKP